MNRLYEVETSVESNEQVNDAISHIISRLSMQYESLVYFLTDNQYSLLKAIAKEGQVVSPQGGVFISRYDLGSASSVKTA